MKLGSFIVSGVVILICSTLWSGHAQAHVLESDNGISAVLHIPPDDVPLAGRATTVSLAFGAASGDFDIKNYRIDLRVIHDGATVQSTPMQPIDGSDRNASAAITFPEAGGYRLAVQGTPDSTGPGPNRNFELSFDVRAVPADGSQPSGLAVAGFDFWIVSAGSMAVLIIVARYQIRKGKRYLV